MTDKDPRAYAPSPQEIVEQVAALWASDEATIKMSYAKLLARVKNANSGWLLSEKRFKTILKEEKLQPKSAPPFTYIKQTTSRETPELDLPKGLRVAVTKNRGKTLFANKLYPKDSLVWEEPALVQAVPVEFLRIMRSGNACAYCAKPLRTFNGRPARGSGFACVSCTGNWCSIKCRQNDLVHPDTFHHAPGKKFNTNVWKEFELLCLDNNWRGGYLYGLALLHKLKHDARRPHARKQLDAMATVREDIRFEAVASKGTPEYTKAETMWEQAHSTLSRAVANIHDLSYQEFMEGVGMVCINNMDDAIYLLHSHLDHSCEPNVEARIISRADGIEVVALQEIKPGQELRVSYVDPTLPVKERQELLRVNWGFICSCDRCKAELQQTPEAAENSKEATNGEPLKAVEQEPESPTEPAIKSALSGNRKRSKSVRFDQNPVTQCVEIPAR